MRTRHYWLNFAEDNKNYTKKQVINVMFDDANKHSCDNCMYNIIDKNKNLKCSSNDSMIEWIDLECYPEFSCKFWEQKKEGK